MAFLPVDTTATARATRAVDHDASRCGARAAAAVSMFVNEKPLSDAGGRQGEQALRRQGPRGAAARRATTACGCTFKSAADVAGGKRAAAAVDVAGARPGGARVRPPARSRRSRRARSTSAATRRRALVPGGIGSRALVLLAAPGRRAPGVGVRRRQRRAARRGRAGGRRRQAGAHACTRATSARAGPTRCSTAAPPAGTRRASISIARGRRATSPGPSRASS